MQEKQSELSATSRLIELINPMVAPLGYEVVYLEVQTHRQKTLRIFIDFADPSPDKTIGIEDCVKVTRALDEPLDQIAEIEAVFKGPYELEVSSPGVDRPLRQAKDFQRFSGRDIRIHVFRPLTAEELGNSVYQQKNPKQKNFMGTLVGIRNDKVLLAISTGVSPDKKKTSSKANASQAKEEISIPLPLISKANLEPRFEFGE